MNEPQHRTPTATPALDALLGRLRSELRTQVWLHGLGLTATVLAGWLVFAFLADWGLSVPRPVRVFHSVVVVVLGAWFLGRSLVRPLRRLPRRSELAVLLEREHPELHELLVSAVQLREGSDRDASPELVARVLADAEERARALTTAGVLDRRRPRLALASGIASVGIFGLVIALRPEHGAIFLDRLLGGDRPWPQRTHLVAEVPLPGKEPVREAGELAVRVARGSDVPLVVRAFGEVPDVVTLTFDSGAELELTPVGGDTFRTLLPALQEDVVVTATGGDDDDGTPRVSIEVLQPPDVTRVAVAVRPPAYTGRPPRVVFDQDVEIVAGAELRVHVATDPSDVDGIARLLPEDREVALRAEPFPAAPDAPEGAPAPTAGFAFDLVPSSSVRFRFELIDRAGLSNPDPGLFAVDVLEDRPPQVTVVSPAAARAFLVPGGALAVRVRVEDDFGIGDAALSVHRRGEEAALLERSLDLVPEDDGAAVASGAGPRRARAVTRVESSDLAPEGETPRVGDFFDLAVAAADRREPEAGLGRAPAKSIQVISTDELLRRVQDRLAAVRVDASELVDLQREKLSRVDELLSTLQSDSPLLGDDSQALQAALVGQRRVQGDARSLLRELSGITETVLYARLDEKAGPLLDELDALLAEDPGQSFQVEAWRRLVEGYRSGTVGSPGFSGQLVTMVAEALDISEDRVRESTAALDRALAATDAADVFEALAAAADSQRATLEALESLLERLAEWDNFQSVLALTRDILNSQKALRERTREFAQDE